MPVPDGETLGWLRAGVGAALIAAPGTPLRLAGHAAPSAASVLLMRTIGIRDLVLGLGAVAAARSDDARAAGRWTAAGLASDSLDVAASLASVSSIGRRDSVAAALLALGFAAADLMVLRRSAAAAG